MHADGEQDHHRNGGAQTVFRQGHEDAHDTLDGLPEPQAPQSSSHAEFARSPVRRDTTDGSREYVHQTIARCQDTGDGQINVELIVQVRSDDVVHGQLDAKAEAVRQDHAPHSVVLHANHVDLPRRFLFESTRSVQEFVVTVWQILTEKHDSHATQQVRHTRDDVRPSPSGERAVFRSLEHTGVDQRHDKLRDTATKVTPASGSCVGNTDALTIEHDRHPELACDERRQTEPDAQTANQKSRRTGDERHSKAERSSD